MRDKNLACQRPKKIVTKIKDYCLRANCKYKRVRTLVKNCREISKLCNVKINLLVFSKWGGIRCQENYTDESVKLENILANVP